MKSGSLSSPDDSNQDLRDLILGTETLVYGDKSFNINQMQNGPPKSRFSNQWNYPPPMKPEALYTNANANANNNDNWPNSSQSRQSGTTRYNPQPYNNQLSGNLGYVGASSQHTNTNFMNIANQHYYDQQQHQHLSQHPHQHLHQHPHQHPHPHQQHQQQWFQHQQNTQQPEPYHSLKDKGMWNYQVPSNAHFTPTAQQFYPNCNYNNTSQLTKRNDISTIQSCGNHYCNNPYCIIPSNVGGPLLLPQYTDPFPPSVFNRPKNIEFYHCEPPSGRHTSLEKLLEQHLQLMNDINFTPSMDLQISSRYGPYDTCSTYLQGPKTLGSQRSSGVSSMSAKTVSTSISPPSGVKTVETTPTTSRVNLANKEEEK